MDATGVVGKQRAGKEEYFAKLASAPAVFVLKKETHDILNKDSFAYRPLNLWQLQQLTTAAAALRGHVFQTTNPTASTVCGNKPCLGKVRFGSKAGRAKATALTAVRA